ncbi:allantoinase isoform X3 [Carya illinoinensis]|uniref:allantoinase isoform X3 n=1 Tax=Carya illinoinensis TaxID=32201 RepID=UPI001C71F170|nr:allantoinase isoform X3 [Carya illinoinensis]
MEDVTSARTGRFFFVPVLRPELLFQVASQGMQPSSLPAVLDSQQAYCDTTRGHFWCSFLDKICKWAVEIKEGKIVTIVKEEDRHWNSKEGHVVDYGEAVVMPGLIDMHAHLDDPGRADWEGFPSGTKAAAAGGITTLVDMPLNNFPSTMSQETLKLKIEAAKERIYVDVGFWGGLVPENAFNSSSLEGLLNAGALGLKSFMCPSGINDFPMTNINHIKEGLSVLAKYRRPLLVHAELQQDSESHLEIKEGSDDPRLYSTYLKTRPPSWEEAAIKELVTVTKDTRNGGPAEGAHLHIVHLSDSSSSLDLIKEGHIDVLSSDHSPTLPELKLLDDGNFLKAWGGISSLQFILPVTWSYGQKYGVTLEQLALWWSERPAKLAGLELKGAIAVGNHADIAIWEPEVEFDLNDGYTVYLKHPSISAYMGSKLSGRTLATFVRGNLVYKKEEHAPAACGVPILAR